MEWTVFEQYATAQTREAFTDQHPSAMGMEEEIAHLDEDYTALPVEQYQRILPQVKHVAEQDASLQHEDASPWNLPVAAQFDTEPRHTPSVETVSMEQYEDIPAIITYDISNELETATSVTFSLVDIHRERTVLDSLKHRANPAGALYRLGHVPGFIFPDKDGFYTGDRFHNENVSVTIPDVLPYMTRKRRYLDHVKTHGARVMVVGGTDALQLTMRPRMQGSVDAMFHAFYTGQDGVGMPTLSPLLYAPFMNSPVLRNGEVEMHMARDAAYRSAFIDSAYADKEETRKWGFIPELATVGGVADTVQVFAEKPMQFSAGIAADSFHVVNEKGTPKNSFYEEYGDQFTNLSQETEVHVRVGTGTPLTFKEFVEQQEFTGIVTLPDPEAEIGEEVVVHVDYTDLDNEAFKDVAWKHFLAHSTGVWPSFRPRFGAGAVESRDFGNSPRIREAIDTQAAVFLQWREVQGFAAEHLALGNEDAEELRHGIATHGLEYELPSGYTVKQVWTGDELDNSLLDILVEGVLDASYGLPRTGTYEEERKQYADRYRDRMEEYLGKGTYAEVFAQQVRDEGREAALEATRLTGEN